MRRRAAFLLTAIRPDNLDGVISLLTYLATMTDDLSEGPRWRRVREAQREAQYSVRTGCLHKR
jgi:hypothetical protein